MRIQAKNMRRFLIVLAVIPMLALSACGAGNADATPTLSVDAIFTAAFETLRGSAGYSTGIDPAYGNASPNRISDFDTPANPIHGPVGKSHNFLEWRSGLQQCCLCK